MVPRPQGQIQLLLVMLVRVRLVHLHHLSVVEAASVSLQTRYRPSSALLVTSW
jgi:hypothetical protein